VTAPWPLSPLESGGTLRLRERRRLGIEVQNRQAVTVGASRAPRQFTRIGFDTASARISCSEGEERVQARISRSKRFVHARKRRSSDQAVNTSRSAYRPHDRRHFRFCPFDCGSDPEIRLLSGRHRVLGPSPHLLPGPAVTDAAGALDTNVVSALDELLEHCFPCSSSLVSTISALLRAGSPYRCVSTQYIACTLASYCSASANACSTARFAGSLPSVGTRIVSYIGHE